MKFIIIFFLSVVFCRDNVFNNDSRKIYFQGTAQGTTYHITYYSVDSVVTKKQVDSILDKIDSSLSLYKSYSLINQFNNSDEGVIPDIHFKNVLKKSLRIYKETNGLFDIAVEPLTAAWGFGPDKIKKLPDSSAIKAMLPCINSNLLYWDKNMLKKKKTCVKLDANGIAQGYSVDVLANFFEQSGLRDYLIELGGEIRIKGKKFPGNGKMSVGIEAPGDDPEYSVIERIVWIDEGAITTSGSYRRYYESNGKKITHLINPKTGYSIQNELISVTVYAKDAITADGYDNALMAMGMKRALAFVEKRKDIAAHFIYRKADGTITDTMSKRFRVLLKPW